MIDTSFDCAEFYEANEGSMNKIGREIKVGGFIKEDNHQEKQPVYRPWRCSKNRLLCLGAGIRDVIRYLDLHFV